MDKITNLFLDTNGDEIEGLKKDSITKKNGEQILETKGVGIKKYYNYHNSSNFLANQVIEILNKYDDLNSLKGNEWGFIGQILSQFLDQLNRRKTVIDTKDSNEYNIIGGVTLEERAIMLVNQITDKENKLNLGEFNFTLYKLCSLCNKLGYIHKLCDDIKKDLMLYLTKNDYLNSTKLSEFNSLKIFLEKPLTYLNDMGVVGYDIKFDNIGLDGGETNAYRVKILINYFIENLTNLNRNKLKGLLDELFRLCALAPIE